MGIVYDVGHALWPREHGGTWDALLIECREPAADASHRRRGPPRIQLRDATGVIVVLFNLVACDARWSLL